MADKQSISKIIGCLYEFYLKQDSYTDFFYDTTLYLVNNGTDVLDSKSYTDIYLGSKHLTNIQIIDKDVTLSKLNSDDYPINKMYLQPVVKKYNRRDVITGFNTYFKIEDGIINISNNRTNKPSILVETPEEIEDKTLLKMTTNYHNRVEQVLVNIFCVDDEGFNSKVYKSLLSRMRRELVTIPGHEVLVWRRG